MGLSWAWRARHPDSGTGSREASRSCVGELRASVVGGAGRVRCVAAHLAAVLRGRGRGPDRSSVSRAEGCARLRAACAVASVKSSKMVMQTTVGDQSVADWFGGAPGMGLLEAPSEQFTQSLATRRVASFRRVPSNDRRRRRAASRGYQLPPQLVTARMKGGIIAAGKGVLHAPSSCEACSAWEGMCRAGGAMSRATPNFPPAPLRIGRRLSGGVRCRAWPGRARCSIKLGSRGRGSRSRLAWRRCARDLPALQRVGSLT